MKKQYRLRKNLDFQNIISKKQQIVTNTLILYYQPNNSHIRLGLSVSKKFVNAVGRNLVKRRLRSIINKIKPWDIQYDCVLIVRKGFLNINYEKQTREVKKILKGLENGTK